MSKDEARKLLGGYATGSLTEAERAALFQAALEDQELFDELAGEQVLKEVLDEPGARQRLIAALEPPRKHRAWLWVPAAATVAIAVVIGIVVFQRTPPSAPPQQLAEVLKSPEPVNAPAAPPVAELAPAPVRRKVAPAPAALPAPSPGPPAPPELKKEERATLAEQVSPPLGGGRAAGGGGRGGGRGGRGGAAAGGAQAAATGTDQAVAPELKKEEKGTLAEQADQVQQPRPQAAAGALRQFAAAKTAPSVFAFNYSVSADGFLVIVPTAPGFLSVTANDSVIFPSGAVNAGTRLRIAIPSGATSLVIGFSAMPGITGAPERRDGSVGTVTDQDPPNGKILIQLSLTPAPR